MDREKVIKGLEVCTSKPCFCKDCPYAKDCYLDSQEVMEDALSLLKEQEAKPPVEYEHNGYWYNICPTCGNHDEELLRQWNYCPFCGQKVKWK